MGKFRIRDAIIAVLGFIVVGTIAFHLIEGLTLIDSFYLSAQTVTTVGFGDIAPKTTAGKIFSTIYMLVGVGVVLFALTSAVQSIVQSELLAAFEERRRARKMSQHREHFIICGAGRVGSNLIRDLKLAHETFIVLERDSQRISQLTAQGVPVLIVMPRLKRAYEKPEYCMREVWQLAFRMMRITFTSYSPPVI